MVVDWIQTNIAKEIAVILTGYLLISKVPILNKF